MSPSLVVLEDPKGVKTPRSLCRPFRFSISPARLMISWDGPFLAEVVRLGGLACFLEVGKHCWHPEAGASSVIAYSPLLSAGILLEAV